MSEPRFTSITVALGKFVEALQTQNSVVDSITRYHDTMARLTNRTDGRSEPSRYEAVALTLGNTVAPDRGVLLTSYPPPDSALFFGNFFPTLYRAYDFRFVYAAPALKSVTQRLEWAADSPALSLAQAGGLIPRIA